MSDKIRFVSICNGVEIEIDPQDPEMPEDVRAYYRELTRQAQEDLDEGVTEMPDGCVPVYVKRYIVRKLFERLARIEQDMETPVTDADQAELAEYMRSRSEMMAMKIAENVPEKERGAIIQLGRLFGSSFRVILERDEDWQGLTVDQAIRLYAGVVMAACTGMVAYYRKIRDHKNSGADGEGSK